MTISDLLMSESNFNQAPEIVFCSSILGVRA